MSRRHKPRLPVLQKGRLSAKGLVGGWAMSEGSGDNTRDSSLFRNHGTLIGPTWMASPMGPALNYPNTTDYMRVSNADALQPPVISGRVVHHGPASTGTSCHVLCKGSTLPRIDYDLYYKWDGTLHLRFYDGAWRDHSLAGVPRNTMKDVGFCLNGARAKIWVDGELKLDEAETNAMPASGGDLFVGNYSTSPTASLLGQIVGVRLWDREITSAELSEMHAKLFTLVTPRRLIFPAAAAGPSFVPYPYPQHDLTGGLAV